VLFSPSGKAKLIRPPIRLPITERTQAAEARRAAGDLARSLGFSDTQAGEIAIVLTEAGNNLVNHSVGGEILLSATVDDKRAAIEMLAIDRGPGMDVARCLEDGYSTAGTSGTGLGAIRRLAGTFDVWSGASGTVVMARFEREPHTPHRFVVGSARAPKAGETACGDAWAVKEEVGRIIVLVADGLGHGHFAADASRMAVEIFNKHTFRGCADLIRIVHGGLKGTRGAAISVAFLNGDTKKVSFCGLGNVSGVILRPGGAQNMVSLNGTAGHQAAKIGEFEYSWPESALLVMYSDGLMSSWSLDRYPGLSRRHPSVIAGVLYRDYTRGRDDVTVVVVAEANA
jgi:anti-sigma regulatory factor (Ser/Thr protein kinase)